MISSSDLNSTQKCRCKLVVRFELDPSGHWTPHLHWDGERIALPKWMMEYRELQQFVVRQTGRMLPMEQDLIDASAAYGWGEQAYDWDELVQGLGEDAERAAEARR